MPEKSSRHFCDRLLPNLKTDYGLDLLGSDARFAESALKVGLPQ